MYNPEDGVMITKLFIKKFVLTSIWEVIRGKRIYEVAPIQNME